MKKSNLKSSVLDLETKAVSDKPTFLEISSLFLLDKSSAFKTTPAGLPPFPFSEKALIICTLTIFLNCPFLFFICYIRWTIEVIKRRS